jgi:hypothetical protein
MACVGRFVGQIELIGYFWQQVVKGAFVHHGDVEEFLGNREVSACGIASHNYT